MQENKQTFQPSKAQAGKKYIRLRQKPAWSRIFFSLGGLVFIVILALGIRTAMAINSISADSGGVASFVKSLPRINGTRLEGETRGRVNILLIGIGGKGHKGGQLADTIIVFSLNTKTNQVALLSIPRDMYVPIPNRKGYFEKVNAIHTLGETAPRYKLDGGGPALLSKTLSKVLEIDIPYYVRVDFGGFKKIVDALGGVDITVEKTIKDPFYPAPNMVNFEPFYLKAGPQHLDGNTALKFVRSRKTSSDFDRARRQQQLIEALKNKLLAPGVLSNPFALNNFMAIAQNSLKTNLSIGEVKRLSKIAKEVDSGQIITRVLDSSAQSPLVVGQGEGYFLVPRAGLKDYSQVAKVAQDIFNDSKTSQSK